MDEITYEIGQEREMAGAGGDLIPFIRCLRCGMKSFNPSDITNLYCRKCHMFHDPAPGARARTDRVELTSGIDNLREQLRIVARLANQAGLEGFHFVDVEMEVDVKEAQRVLSHGSIDERFVALAVGIKSSVVIKYRRRQERSGKKIWAWLYRRAFRGTSSP